jgi:hypothetical protein
VQATNLDTKQAYKATSGADGSYSLSGLPEGNYEVSVDNIFPFLPVHQTGIRVAGGKAARLDLRLNDVNLNTLGDGGVEFAHALADKPLVSGPCMAKLLMRRGCSVSATRQVVHYSAQAA